MSIDSITRIQALTSELNQYRAAYYGADTSPVSDAVYDRLHAELQRLETETGLSFANSPTRTVGHKAVEGLAKARHDIPLLSLDSTKSERDLLRFSQGKPALLMMKLDGLTLELVYEDGALQRLSTRGDGDEGEDVTHNASAISGIPMTIMYKQRLVVTGEAFILKSTFEKLKETLVDSTGKRYKNARNMAAGAIRKFDAADCGKRGVRFSAFRVLEGFEEDPACAASKGHSLRQLQKMGFSTCPRMLFSTPSAKGYSEGIKTLKDAAERAGIPIDGMVVTFDDVAYSKSCGRTGHHYKDGYALKFEDELYETVLCGIEWNPSRSGELAPVALFNTVEIDGCAVGRATLHNITIIRKLQLRPGCRILVSKRNMIIPHVEDNLDKADGLDDALIPLVCPSCGGPTRLHRRDGKKKAGQEPEMIETLRCDNEHCGEQKLRRLIHFAGEKAMDIEGLSRATLAAFIERGWLNTVMDVYRLNLHADAIEQLEGFGPQSWQRLWSAIESSRNTTFERYVVAMDIPMVGRSASGELCRHFSGDLCAFEAAVDNGYDFGTLPDIGKTLNANIHQWFRDENNRNTWEELQKMLNIKNEPATPVENNGGAFAGCTIVVTGTLVNYTRSQIEAEITRVGAKMGKKVSKNTNYLVCGEKPGSKLADAEKLGIPILSEDAFLEMAAA